MNLTSKLQKSDTGSANHRDAPGRTPLLRPWRELLRAWLIVCTLLCPAVLHAAPLPVTAEEAQQDDVLAGVDRFAQGASESSEVTLDKNMMGLASSMMLMQSPVMGVNLALMSMMHKMDSVLVRNYEYAAAGQYKMEDVEQIRKRLQTGSWSHLVKSRSATESSDICVKTDAEGTITEMVIVDAEPKELSFIHLRGHMSPKDLSLLSGAFGGPGDLTPKQLPK